MQFYDVYFITFLHVLTISDYTDDQIDEFCQAFIDFAVVAASSSTYQTMAHELETVLIPFHNSIEKTDIDKGERCTDVNFSDRITDKLGYSKNRLSIIFKKNTKINIQTYINIEKLKLIKEMLLTNNFSKTYIADKFHFCDTKCLCHFFKKHALYTMSFFLNMER